MHERGELPDAEAGARGHRHQQHRQLLALLPGAGDDWACFAPSATAATPARFTTSRTPALVVIIGSNTAESHPVLATRVKRAHKLHGQKLIVADLREHEMARRADLFLRPQPGTDLVWLSAVSRYLLDNGLAEYGVSRRNG